jgi:hypothetical protein
MDELFSLDNKPVTPSSPVVVRQESERQVDAPFLSPPSPVIQTRRYTIAKRQIDNYRSKHKK